MISDRDKEWLRENHPKLKVDGEEVSGVIDFSAAYDHQNNNFLILEKNSLGPRGYRQLAGSFRINIRERTDKSFSRLPALQVEDVEAILDRHFNPSDGTACLGSPLEEDDFLIPEFRFQPFLEQLVIPFLYGQLFYSVERRWPWSEYAHGPMGLLEAYVKVTDAVKAAGCLEKLCRYEKAWPWIKYQLQRKSKIKGHTRCFCDKMDQMKRCHPRALEGIRRLREDIKVQRIVIP